MTAIPPKASAPFNYANDTLVLGMSDLRLLRRERPMVLTGGRGIHVRDEDGRDYIEAVSSFYCVALGYSNPELVEAATRHRAHAECPRRLRHHRL